MRSSSTSGHNTPTATHTYSPSVPLSVYRELAAELQAKEALLNSLNAQNQELAKQNQQLRQEIAKAVQSVLHLQQLVDSAEAVNRKYAELPTPDPRRSVKVFTELEEGRYRRRSQPESASQISGWWLAIAILLIITTAFGAGYLIVRPLLHSR